MKKEEKSNNEIQRQKKHNISTEIVEINEEINRLRKQFQRYENMLMDTWVSNNFNDKKISSNDKRISDVERRTNMVYLLLIGLDILWIINLLVNFFG